MKILVYGEIIWDVFEDNRKIGGAPLNFGAHLAKFGVQSYILSSVGNDNLGKDSLKHIKDFGVYNDFINISEVFPTGISKVVCDEDGQPSYQIMENVAYDNILISNQTIQNINSLAFDAFYFGTLAQRNEVSQRSLIKLLLSCKF